MLFDMEPPQALGTFAERLDFYMRTERQVKQPNATADSGQE
jgi:hypothetical protein